MNQLFTPAYTAGIIYLILALMWGIIIAMLVSGIGSSNLAQILQGDINSFDFTFLTLGVYTLVSLLLAVLLLVRTSFRPATLKIIVGVALILLIASPFLVTGLFGVVAYFIAYLFTYKFYKGHISSAKSVRHLRVVK